MALSNPSESPAVVVREIDLTGGVPNVQSTTGATIINSRWGTVEERVRVSDEADLVDKFASPDSATSISFHRASFFLRYSNALELVRVIDSTAKNARSTTGQTAADSDSTLPAEVVKNSADFDAQLSALDSDSHTFVAKYPGALGNSLQVSICPHSANDSAFNQWAYKNEFDAAPGTSDFATKNNATNDEVHVAIIDKQGKFTGTQGTLLERYAFLSLGKNAKTTAGSNIFVKDVINETSKYAWLIDFDSDFRGAGAGTNIDSGDNFTKTTGTTNTDIDYNFAGGIDVASLSTANILAGFDLFEDKDAVDSDFLIPTSDDDFSSAVSTQLNRFKSSSLMVLLLINRVCLSQSMSPLQKAVPTRIIGIFLILEVWISVIASISSSRVPNPPGKTTNACAYLTNITFRTKK